jgi:glycosyltransferase involved in cell wall biosynthesis
MRPDIINLHWVSAGFLRIESLRKLKAPLVWTLHDMWPFTGGCHLSHDCIKFTGSCGACPILKSSRDFDLSRWIWRRKARVWKNLNLTIVTPSRWLAKRARISSLFKNFRIEIIPNGLDSRVFRPIDKKIARDALGIPEGQKIVLFGSVHPESDANKGFQLLKRALQAIKEQRKVGDITCLIFGVSGPRKNLDIGLSMHYLGFLHDDITLALAYSAADAFILPSLQENLPNTVMEALSCGTPCVAFNAGGTPEMIVHKKNGYLAHPFDVEDLGRGILWVLGNEARSKALSEYARKKAQREFDLGIQAKCYRALFDEIINLN